MIRPSPAVPIAAPDAYQEQMAREQQVILDTAGVGIVFIRRRRLKRCNQRFAEIFGHPTVSAALQRSNASLYPNDEAFHALGRAAYPVMAQGLPFKTEMQMRHADGHLFWAHLTGKLINPQDTAEGSIWIVDDISEQKEAATRMQSLLQQQKLIFDNALVSILFMQNRRVVRCNRAFEAMLGYGPGELDGAPSRTWYLSDQDWEEATVRCYAPLQRGEVFHEEMRLRRKDGSAMYCDVQAQALDPTDLSKGTIWNGIDVTERRLAQEQLAEARANLEQLVQRRTDELRRTVQELEHTIAQRREAEAHIQHLAHFDALTGLPNRLLLDDRCRTAIAAAHRAGSSVALMFLDLDHFKTINDSLGHRVGDAVLVELAHRLRQAVREQDTVSRLGGDEFVLLLPDTEAEGAANVAAKILQTALEPFLLDGHELTVTPSIGIALYPQDGGNLEDLSRCADAAMYLAKEEGRNSFRFFTASVQARSERNLLLGNALRRALEREQLSLVYQPQLNLATGRLIGVEALVRWNHPELGPISPAEFIPVAESNGLILPIGEWVLRAAARQAAEWLQQGWSPWRVSINVSAVQFRHGNLPTLVREVLATENIPPHVLELELTEGVALYNSQQVSATMEQLADLGIPMAMDDFGTGYSSLSYLKRYKVSKLKIDQSFVRDIVHDPDDRAIVQAIIRMAHSLGLSTIAEGVETQEQIDFLHSQGCNQIQGYWLSKPLDARALGAWMRQRGQFLR
ncbi:EAL domain-containing protein [Curvibacter sp. APW13]|uniref:putative bifunctional diguanylate cyclase/phosphodiesterase n=1 Tax=Curvibacter sp. APW13 TaxID=3077236 RepID=UPI0028E047F5|nr:EAL domain-containing protein [Curvibacter sp. APW13]MDT8990071.1 EAL domain-containing protein [Curvibacter sp. APW13]